MLSSIIGRLSHIWEASHPTVLFWPHVKWSCNLFPAEDTTVHHPGKAELSHFFSCLEGAKHDHMHGNLGGKSSTTPMRVQETSCSVHLDVVTGLADFDDMRSCYHRLFMAAVPCGPRLLREDLCLSVVCVKAAKDGRKRVVGG